MVPLSPPENNLQSHNFAKRVFSSAVAGPIALGAVILGFPYVEILAVLLLCILLWEWSKMSGLPLLHPLNGAMVILMGGMVWGGNVLLSALGLTLMGVLYTIFYHYKVGARFLSSLILLSGPLYIGLGMVALLTLARFSHWTLLWTLLIVWTTDISAFVVGTLLGGPKLAPRISPSKTWSGIVGGSMAGSALGVTLAPYCQIDITNPIFLLSLTIMITLIGHTGDLLESAAKRLFKVKDSSHIIPGHGGLLDRMDSILLVAPFLMALKFFKLF